MPPQESHRMEGERTVQGEGSSSDWIERALAEFAAAARAGKPPDPEEFIRTHPNCGPALRDRLTPFLTSPGTPGSEDRPGTASLPQLPSPPGPGTLLGDFRLIREIGHGGMGTVFEGEQVSTGRIVAVKVLSLDPPPDQESVERFRREGRLAGSLSHPRCVFVFSADEIDGVPFLAMDRM